MKIEDPRNCFKPYQFFLSKTPIIEPNYSYNTISDFLSKNDYKKYGLTVLRATLMNPYIYPYKKKGVNLVRDFILSLHSVAQEIASKISRE